MKRILLFIFMIHQRRLVILSQVRLDIEAKKLDPQRLLFFELIRPPDYIDLPLGLPDCGSHAHYVDTK